MATSVIFSSKCLLVLEHFQTEERITKTVLIVFYSSIFCAIFQAECISIKIRYLITLIHDDHTRFYGLVFQTKFPIFFYCEKIRSNTALKLSIKNALYKKLLFEAGFSCNSVLNELSSF